MKYIIMFLISFSLFSAELRVEAPGKVGVGEIFDIKVKVSSDEKPEINFNLENLEQVAKSEGGYSSNITVINGRTQRRDEYIFNYSFRPLKKGRALIKNIHTVVKGKTDLHNEVEIEVVKAVQSDKNIFIRADVSKKDLYKNEQIKLDYNLYYKVEVSNYNILAFPKLEGFLKRFRKEAQKKEMVKIGGEKYMKILLYSSVLYTDKSKAIIDPMIAQVIYPVRGGADPFRGFGFGFRERRKKNYASSEVEISSKDLPIEGRDKSFTGLVGKHTFTLSVNKEKVLVNEPIEIKFSVSGPGNLESYQAPDFLNNEKFEKFESDSKLQMNHDLTATKTFTYTFLPKFNHDQKAKNLKFSFFNPETKSYEFSEVKFPAIIVRGGAVRSNGEKVSTINPIKFDFDRNILGPYIKSNKKSLFSSIHKSINVILMLLSVIFFLLIFFDKKTFLNFLENRRFKNLSGKNFNYANVYRYLDGMNEKSENARLKVKNSELSSDAKMYFLTLLDSHSLAKYSKNKKKIDVTFNKKYFNEVEGIINKSLNNEDSSES